jgi:uncharacterized protein YdeI (YjbR/CyaY-like superfamily)
MKEEKDGIRAVVAKTPAEWRKWLSDHSADERSVWLVIFGKNSGVPSVNHDEAVNEALCFGWIDSKSVKRDEHSRYQLFSSRKPKSKWSAINKKKVAALIESGKMTPAGQKVIDQAKASGMWDALNDVEALKVPDDLQAALSENKQAKENWEQFPPSARKAILQWIGDAKREETRNRRIETTVAQAEENIRANQPQPGGKSGKTN